MARKIKHNTISPLEILAFLSAFAYIHSVNTVAHHAALWMRPDVSETVEAPAIGALVFSLLAILYAWRKNEWKNLGTINVVSLTMLACGSLFWVSGLRANFF